MGVDSKLKNIYKVIESMHLVGIIVGKGAETK